MASGKKNYFRHDFNARKHPSIAGLIDDHGKEAYFHFFAIVELCAQKASDGFPSDSRFVFRRSTLCHELFVTNSRLAHHLLAITPSLVDQVLVEEKEVTIVFSKLRKYMGKYESKLPSNSPNKIKEKEIKEKESKVKEIKANELFVEFENSPLTQVLTQVDLELQKKWVEVYGKEFCLAEFNKIYTWLAANPTKSPKANFGKFINTWLTRGWESHRKTLPTNFSKAQAIQDRLVNYKNPFTKEKHD
jgi:hypothetical protein